MYSKTEEMEKPYSKAEIAKIKQALEDLKKFRGNPKVEAFTRRLEESLEVLSVVCHAF